uniref:Uncharacterized protein n=1 Tax=Aureoumbra lagunensis TaxID=44058 RepID=A0A7S3JZL9_9STRA
MQRQIRIIMSWNSSEEILEYVRGRTGNYLSKKIKIVLEDQVKNPLIVNAYLQHLDKTNSLAHRRVQSHVRQWLALFRCWSYLVHMSKDEAYKAVIRLRDDSFVFQPILIYSMNVTDSVLILSCNGWGGYNDKNAIFDAK